LTHFVPWDDRGKRIGQALCGDFIDRHRGHAAQPTCPDCQRLQAEYEALDLGQDDPPATGVRS
jgi:hypothetical protein